MSRVNRDRKRN